MTDRTYLNALLENARLAIRQGRLDEAETMAERALERDAGSVVALQMIAAIAWDRHDLARAEMISRQILAISPNEHIASGMLAQILMQTDRLQEAEIVWREMVALYPDDAAAHVGLADILSSPVQLMDSAWHLERAISISGRQAPLLVSLARNLASQGSLDEAESLAEEAALVDPGLLAPLLLLVEIAEQRGQLDAASRAIDRAMRAAGVEAVDLEPARTALLARGGAWREALSRLDAEADLPGTARLLRGRLKERAGRYAEAWEDFVEGKAILARQAGRRYDRDLVEAHFSALARAFSAPFWRSVPKVETRRDVPQPIFVLGFPRSGTTMIEQVLSSHSAIRAGGELPFVNQLRDFAQTLLGRGLPFPAGIGELASADHHHVPTLFRDFYLALAAKHGLTAEGAAFFTDKMPLNETYLPLVRLAFPDAPMVLVRRHPFDTLVSVMSHDMTHGFHCGYRLADAAHQLAAVSQLTVHYRDVLGLRFHDLAYERFIAHQSEETEALMRIVGLPTEAAQFRFHESPRHAPTPSYAQVKEPLHARSVERWRNYAAELSPALRLVASAMQDGGYTA